MSSSRRFASSKICFARLSCPVSFFFSSFKFPTCAITCFFRSDACSFSAPSSPLSRFNFPSSSASALSCSAWSRPDASANLLAWAAACSFTAANAPTSSSFPAASEATKAASDSSFAFCLSSPHASSFKAATSFSSFTASSAAAALASTFPNSCLACSCSCLLASRLFSRIAHLRVSAELAAAACSTDAILASACSTSAVWNPLNTDSAAATVNAHLASASRTAVLWASKAAR
mmetsp:Transcript_51792/g.102730  ORF Transcript_51792/g.102730 Transcript_51792/m.102730 type:complete len:233 (-) Transcript_51792:144-842(-)